MSVVYLYTTAGCHLCEKARVEIWPVLAELQWQLQEIDIADSDDLIERYGIRIPVVALSPLGPELGWPFTTDQLRDFCRQAP